MTDLESGGDKELQLWTCLISTGGLPVCSSFNERIRRTCCDTDFCNEDLELEPFPGVSTSPPPPPPTPPSVTSNTTDTTGGGKRKWLCMCQYGLYLFGDTIMSWSAGWGGGREGGREGGKRRGGGKGGEEGGGGERGDRGGGGSLQQYWRCEVLNYSGTSEERDTLEL